ncbi:MAG: cob(I)yrinic acid a,c-diamide adenosyltransferase [Phycisphaerae bacterium]|nr:cob(I)yrinic acid a,c-diamide adenosyltransferase [Phycisphaerae bacterium]
MLPVPRIVIFTGDGKGKTTAAVGMAVRAIGHGMRVRIIQFVKNDPTTGELPALRRFENVEVTQAGLGFVPPPDDPQFPQHQQAAHEGLKLAAEAVSCGHWNLVILDEICFAVSAGLVTEPPVINLLQQTSRYLCIVLTGRQATPGLIDLADTVTEMRCIKHAMDTGREAQNGVER